MLANTLMAGSMLSGQAVAQWDPLNEPFSARNLNPFILIHGLPGATSSNLLEQGRSSLQLQFDVSNHSKTSSRAEEAIVLDGETYRLAMIYRRGLGDGWQASLELPLVSHRSGIMDNFIEGWHDIFGLSNRDRDPWPKNRLLISYSRHGETLMELTDGSIGVGDLQLHLSRELLGTDPDRQLALHASLKLPTGDTDRLRGSGALDLSLWVSAADPTLFDGSRLGGYLQAGLLLLGEGDILPDQQRDLVWFGGAGIHWRVRPWLMLKAQLDAHSAFYDSELDQLGKYSTLLTVGGSIPFNEGAGAIDLAIGENLATDTIPDFTVNLGYRRHF